MSSIINSINERIRSADTILSELSNLTRIPQNPSNSGVVCISLSIKYDITKVNKIKNDLGQWQLVTKELIISHFGENSRFVKYFNDTIISHKKGQNYKAELTEEIYAGVSVLKSIIESVNILGSLPTDETKVKSSKDPLVFISHSSKDKEFVEALVDLLEGIGLDDKTLFCSSIPGHWIGLSDDIYEALLSLFKNRSLYVIFVQSPNFYASPVSLNEMGAAWVLRAEYCSILTPDMDYKAMTAVVHSHDVAIKVNTEDAPHRLTEMKDAILKFLGKPSVSEVIWERKRDKFLRAVYPSYISDSSSSRSNTEEYQQLMIEKMKKEKEDLRKASIKGNIFPAPQKGCRHLRIFNAGKSTAKNIHIEWLDENEKVRIMTPLEVIDDLTPQNMREYLIVLLIGYPQTMRLKYTWDDDYNTGNTLEESLQL